MDAYEKKQADLSGKIGELDGKIEGLGVSMSQQFSQVTQDLKDLAQRSQPYALRPLVLHRKMSTRGLWVLSSSNYRKLIRSFHGGVRRGF